MLDRRRPPEHVALELAALRVEHEFQANLILRLADALYLSVAERDVLALLAAERQEVAAFAAGLAAEALSCHPPAGEARPYGRDTASRGA